MFSPVIPLIDFTPIFSDEEDFSKGINSFIQSVIDRRKARKSCEGPLTEDMVGVENRILGCATFEKKYVYVFF